MERATRGLVATAPDLIRERLSEPRFVERFLASLEAGVGQCDRTCMRIYAEALKLVGAQHDLAIQIVNVIGAQPGEARSAVETMQRVGAMGEPERVAKTVEWLQARGWRCLPPEASVEATQANGNGHHANGNGNGVSP